MSQLKAEPTADLTRWLNQVAAEYGTDIIEAQRARFSRLGGLEEGDPDTAPTLRHILALGER